LKYSFSPVTTSEIAMSSAYISTLKRGVEAMGSQPKAESPDLRQRFIDWYAGLPEISRDRAFSMSEFEQGLGTQGKYLSPILLSLSWKRKRKWISDGQYSRYWSPPTCGV
jgi:hypothetical protein